MMDTRILEIKTLENKIKNIYSTIDFHYIALGNYIVVNEAFEYSALVEKNGLFADLKSIKDIFRSYDQATVKREKLNNNKEMISEIDRKTKDTLKLINELEKENGKHYIGIAETLYDLFKLDNHKMAAFEHYFSELVVIDNKNKEISDKIKEIENDKKSSFFGNLKDIGEKTILNTKKRYNYSLMLSYFKTAGEKLCIDKVYETATDSQIEALFGSYKNNLKIGEEYSLTIEALSAEKNRLRVENEDLMRELAFDPNAFIKEIKTRKDAAVQDFGKKVFYIISGAEKVSDSAVPLELETEVNRFIGEIKVLNNEKNELDQKMEQVKLAIEIDKTEKDIINYKAAIDKKNEKIGDLNKEIEEYVNMISVAETQLGELKKKVVR
ncbi:MAG: hypothetical protein FWD87_00270 [Spirochaetaceae bacterium]|nr:hypothetical protein [Spirochaetaceae bacterium]